MSNTTKDNLTKVKWRCPSNIAFVKYWGKKAIQIPCNSSLSLTLSNSYTEVEATLSEKTEDKAVQLAYYFEGELSDLFGSLIGVMRVIMFSFFLIIFWFIIAKFSILNF